MLRYDNLEIAYIGGVTLFLQTFSRRWLTPKLNKKIILKPAITIRIIIFYACHNIANVAEFTMCESARKWKIFMLNRWNTWVYLLLIKLKLSIPMTIEWPASTAWRKSSNFINLAAFWCKPTSTWIKFVQNCKKIQYPEKNLNTPWIKSSSYVSSFDVSACQAK